MNVSSPKHIAAVIKKNGIGHVFRVGSSYISMYILHMLLSNQYLVRVKALPKKMSIPAILTFANTQCHGVFKPLQVESEITGLLEHVKAKQPACIVEIGTANGGTLLSLIKVAAPDLIVSIDLPSGEFGGGYPRYKIPLFEAFVKKNQTIHLLRADSHQAETKKQLELILGKRKIDFLLIDGDHTYKGVKSDFDMYSPLVRKGGSIAFHDIVKHSKDLNCGVDKLWKQLAKQYKHITYVEDWNQGMCGIGVILISNTKR